MVVREAKLALREEHAVRFDAANDALLQGGAGDRKSTRLNSSHLVISYAVFCLKKKKSTCNSRRILQRRDDEVGLHVPLTLRPDLRLPRRIAALQVPRHLLCRLYRADSTRPCA